MKTLLKLVLLISLGVILLILKISLSQKEAQEDVAEAVMSCGRFPKEEHIRIDNVTWQVFETPIGLIKLLNAYLDTRQKQSFVRVNTNFVPSNQSVLTIFCQFWFDENLPPFVVQASEILIMWRKFLFRVF